jgi:hypothetical protein
MWCESHEDKSDMSDMRVDNCHTLMLEFHYQVKQTKDKEMNVTSDHISLAAVLCADNTDTASINVLKVHPDRTAIFNAAGLIWQGAVRRVGHSHDRQEWLGAWWDSAAEVMSECTNHSSNVTSLA